MTQDLVAGHRPRIIGGFQALWRPKVAQQRRVGRELPLAATSSPKNLIRQVGDLPKEEGKGFADLRGVRHERTPYKRRLFGPRSHGRGGSNSWRNVAIIARGWRRRVLCMQLRQSADIFTFPIVKAVAVSQNSPTNQGANELLSVPVPIVSPVVMCWAATVYIRWVALATRSSRCTMPNPAVVGRGRVVPQVESVLAQDAVTGSIVQDGLTEEGV